MQDGEVAEGDDVVATLALGEGGHGRDDSTPGLGDESARDLDALAGRDHVVVDHDVHTVDGLDLIGAEEEVLCFSGGPAGAADLRSGRLLEVLLVLAGEDRGQVRLTSEDVEEALHLAAVRADDDLHARRHLLCECLADELVDLPLARRVEERDGHRGGHARDREDELPVDPFDRQVHLVKDRDAEGLGERLLQDRLAGLLAPAQEAVLVVLLDVHALGEDGACGRGLEAATLRFLDDLRREDHGLALHRDDLAVGTDHDDAGEVFPHPVHEAQGVLDADGVARGMSGAHGQGSVEGALVGLLLADGLLVDAGGGAERDALEVADAEAPESHLHSLVLEEVGRSDADEEGGGQRDHVVHVLCSFQAVRM